MSNHIHINGLPAGNWRITYWNPVREDDVDPILKLDPVFYINTTDETMLFTQPNGDGNTPNIGEQIGSVQNLGSLGGFCNAPSAPQAPTRTAEGAAFDGIDDKLLVPPALNQLPFIENVTTIGWWDTFNLITGELDGGFTPKAGIYSSNSDNRPRMTTDDRGSGFVIDKTWSTGNSGRQRNFVVLTIDPSDVSHSQARLVTSRIVEPEVEYYFDLKFPGGEYTGGGGDGIQGTGNSLKDIDQIGASAFGDYFIGRIQGVAFFDRALSQEELDSLPETLGE